jgi:hypothetical protein
MADKKIIEKDDVKQNNPNDDEEILKNNPDTSDDGTNMKGSKGSQIKNEKTEGSETIGIP